MARKCPDCRSDLEGDGVHAWCPNADCAFEGYVVIRTGKVIRDAQELVRDWNADVKPND